MLEDFGIAPNTFPAFGLSASFDYDTEKYGFDPDTELTSDNVIEFCEKYLEGNLKPMRRSESVRCASVLWDLAVSFPTWFSLILMLPWSPSVCSRACSSCCACVPRPFPIPITLMRARVVVLDLASFHLSPQLLGK